MKVGHAACLGASARKYRFRWRNRHFHCGKDFAAPSPVPSTHLGSWLDLTTTHWQTWLFSSTSTYHSSDLLTARGVAHLVVHGTGSTSYETISPVQLETSGGVLSTVDMVVQRRDGPRRLRDHDDEATATWRFTNFCIVKTDRNR